MKNSRYNRSEIMKTAWNRYNTFKIGNWRKYSFAECLKFAWEKAKEEVERQDGIKRFEAKQAARANMSVEEKIEEIESRLFIISMGDSISNEDRELTRKLEIELRELKAVA